MSIVNCDICDCSVDTDYPDEIISDETGRTICARCCEKMFDTSPPVSFEDDPIERLTKDGPRDD